MNLALMAENYEKKKIECDKTLDCPLVLVCVEVCISMCKVYINNELGPNWLDFN